MGFLKKYGKKLDKGVMNIGRNIEKGIKKSQKEAPQRRRAKIVRLQQEVKIAQLEKRLTKARERKPRKGDMYF